MKSLTGTRSSFFFSIPLLGVVALGLPACSVAHTVESEDFSVIPAARLTFNLISEEESAIREFFVGKEYSERDPLEERPAVEATLAIDGDFSAGRGNSSEDISAGQTRMFEDLTVNGPAEVRVDYDLYAYSFAARGGLWFFERQLGAEAIGGIAFSHLVLGFTSGADDRTDVSFAAGPLAGGQVTYRPIEWLGLYGRGTVSWGYGSGLDFAQIAAFEGGVEAIPLPGFGILAGYRWWDYTEDHEERASFEMQLHGPVLGVHVTF